MWMYNVYGSLSTHDLSMRLVVKQMLAGPSVSGRLGDEISDAVRGFAKDRDWTDANYDLWYHDEPVWIVREETRNGETATVRRVQIRPFDSEDGAALSFTPDAMTFEVDGGHIVAQPSHYSRAKGSVSAPIAALELLLSTPRERLIEQKIEEDPRSVVRSILKRLLAHSWSAAGKLTLEPATE